MGTLAVVLTGPSSAGADSELPDGSNLCLDMTMSVTIAAGTEPGSNTVAATVVARGAAGLHITRLHLDLEIQERTATTWVPFPSGGGGVTFTNYGGRGLHRAWTLRQDADPIYALIRNHVQMRVYAKFQGACRGESLGPPILFGLTAPTMPMVTVSSS